MNTQNLFDAYTKLCYLHSNYSIVLSSCGTWNLSVFPREIGSPVPIAVARSESPDLLTAICDAYDQLVPPTVRNCGGTDDVRQPDRRGEDE